MNLDPSPISKKSNSRLRSFFRRSAFFFFVLFVGAGGAAFISYKQNGSFAPLLVSLATRVVPLFGENSPAFPSPFGHLKIHSKKTERGLFVEISCEPCRLSSEKIGSDPFLIPKANISGTFQKGIFDGQIEAEGVKAKLNGAWDGKSFQGDFHLPETEIQTLYHLFESIVPEAKTAAIEGSVSGSGKFQWPQAFVRWKPKVSKFRVSGLINLSVYGKGKFEHPTQDKDGNSIERESGEGTEDWLPLEALGPLLPQAAISTEDASFYSHPGYDISSMDEALKENASLKKIRRGASTITQQLAKNLFLSPERSYSRKLRELLYAVNLEQLGKKRILELYLNILEWGPDIYGAKTAAKKYFEKAPNELRPEEAAWLAAIIRSPKRSWTKEYLAQAPNMTRVRKVLSRMTNVPEDEKQLAMNRPLRFAH